MLLTTFRTDYLAALLPHVPKRPGVRPQVWGVAVHSDHLVATDGHVLMAIPVELTTAVNLTIPRDAIERYLARKPGKTTSLTREGTGEWHLQDGSIGQLFAPVDVPFPDWPFVVPSMDTCLATNPIGLGFDWELLARFYKSAEKLGDASRTSATVQLLPNGDAHRAGLAAGDAPKPRLGEFERRTAAGANRNRG